jgi:hypothetical protein
MQYTIRGIPAAVDAAIRQRARATGKSLNVVAVEVLAEGSGATGARHKRRSVSGIAGSWRSEQTVDDVLGDQDRIDPDLWR